MMKNKKSQIGKGIIFMPVLILLVILLAVYLFASLAISKLHKPANLEISPPISTDNNLLLQKIKIPINNQEREFLVLDTYILYDKNIIKKQDFHNALIKLLKKEVPCLILAKGYNENPAGEIKDNADSDDFYFHLLENGEINNFEYDKLNKRLESSYKEQFGKYYSRHALSRTISFKDQLGNEKNIEYYYGGCLHL